MGKSKGVKAAVSLGHPPLLVPKHYAVPPLKTFPLKFTEKNKVVILTFKF